MRPVLIALLALSLANCGRLEQVGKAPEFNPVENSNEFFAMTSTPMPTEIAARPRAQEASLWSGSRRSLLGDRRAAARGDILTVVIEIDDKAEISNSTGRSRSSSDTMGMPSMFGIPQRLNAELPEGASMADAYETGSNSSYQGDGSVARNEKLTLRVAATVLDRLPNGVMRIQGVQEVRVNFEVRELIVTGFVRPEDVSRQNEITYDKIAGARISYGGRGQITDVQQPRYGQQVADILLPF
ncbi:flagellar basal body L-ring protein [Rhodobacter sp. TJ_12]|uniref:flagellar basal body L-ring protein FlgH n=1 Tax=Rhodobacter sp. TJ_12 TaxID=2029399 RepID=UPI001CBBE0B4|nr:flagellar basal body L-ring protein FlgH [Rhodobacter sp. TJ_12]MBZ4022013.1 flagellar basal body L-ring protein [Rhodobacter sp. TJ_12]